jgi:hypothetical protein
LPQAVNVGSLNARKPDKLRQYVNRIALDEVPDTDAGKRLSLPDVLA